MSVLGAPGGLAKGGRVGRCLARGRSGRPGEIQLTESPVRLCILPRASLPPPRPHLIVEVHYRATAGAWPASGLNASPHGALTPHSSGLERPTELSVLPFP